MREFISVNRVELSAACFVACWVALVTPRLMHSDIVEHRLPNAVVMPGWVVAVVGISLAWLLEGSFPLTALLSGVIAVVLALLLAIGGGLGMGDVKLLFPLAVGLGLVTMDALLLALTVAVVAGGAVAITMLLRYRQRGMQIAFGPFLLLGYWAGYFA